MTQNYDHQMELFHISNVTGDTRYTVDFSKNASELQFYCWCCVLIVLTLKRLSAIYMSSPEFFKEAPL